MKNEVSQGIFYIAIFFNMVTRGFLHYFMYGNAVKLVIFSN